MKVGAGTIILIGAFLGAFGIELTNHAVGNEASLLKLGALPDNGELHSQYGVLLPTHFYISTPCISW